MELRELVDSKVAILGFGKEGKSTLRFLKKVWVKDIIILDKNLELDKEEWVKYLLGDNYLSNLSEYDVIIKSPWISPYSKDLAPFRDKLTSQTQIFYSNYKWKTVWVTATKGKSTTSTFLYEVLKETGYNAKLVWNIWNPVLDEIDLNSEYDFVVYELSSYMLEDLNKEDYISIVGNIYEDHLDWHDGVKNYQNAKLNNVNKKNKTIINENVNISGENLIKFGKNTDFYYEKWTFYVKWLPVFTSEWFTLKGEHNMMNILSVIVLCTEAWIDLSHVKNVAKKFRALPHRMQEFGRYNWILFVDDAISTTPESTIEALKTYGDKVGTIFLWGLDRGYKFEKLVKKLSEFSIKNVVLFPETWNRIIKLLDESFNICQTTDMKKWVEFAFQNTKDWEVCLLSTASPSYNLWKNFEAKWDDFQKNVKEYKK